MANVDRDFYYNRILFQILVRNSLNNVFNKIHTYKQSLTRVQLTVNNKRMFINLQESYYSKKPLTSVLIETAIL